MERGLEGKVNRVGGFCRNRKIWPWRHGWKRKVHSRRECGARDWGMQARRMTEVGRTLQGCSCWQTGQLVKGVQMQMGVYWMWLLMGRG